jgi:hypothetical protein
MSAQLALFEVPQPVSVPYELPTTLWHLSFWRGDVLTDRFSYESEERAKRAEERLTGWGSRDTTTVTPCDEGPDCNSCGEYRRRLKA